MGDSSTEAIVNEPLGAMICLVSRSQPSEGTRPCKSKSLVEDGGKLMACVHRNLVVVGLLLLPRDVKGEI